MRLPVVLCLILLLLAACGTKDGQEPVELKQNSSEVSFISKTDQVEVHIGGTLIAIWQHGPELTKPIFHPMYTAGGELVTRWFPFKTVEGEDDDHPHHTGLFFTYEGPNSVNFWAARESPPQIAQKELGIDEAASRLSVVLDWTDARGRVLLEEKRSMMFIPDVNSYSIDFDISLTAKDSTAVFHDSKEGMFAIRVAPWLKGEGNGKYRNAEGAETEDNVWGKRSKWMQLEGSKDDKYMGVVIFNHPSSVNYPTYWHARDYGLFAANPLGQGVFQKGRKEPDPQFLNLTLQSGESADFKFRVLVYEGQLSADMIEETFKDYTN